MLRIHPCFGILESGGSLLQPAAAARLARSFASVLPSGSKVLLTGDGSREVLPAMLASKAQFAFMGFRVTEGAGCLPGMAHWMIPHGGFSGGMCFSGTSCWVIGSDGRCPNEALWECILAKFDGGGSDDMKEAVAADGVLAADVIEGYWEHLQKCVNAESIRKAGLRIACSGLPEFGSRFGEIFGVEMLPFSCEKAVAEALPYLKVACGMVFDPSGKRLTLLGSSGQVCPPDSVMLLGSSIVLERGQRSIVSGGFMTKSWMELLRRHELDSYVVPAGEGSTIVSGSVCGTLQGDFSFGGYPGYDALRTAAFLLEFLAAGGGIEDQLNRLRKYHVVHKVVPRGGAAVFRLKGRFNAEEILEEECGVWFDLADGALSAMALPDGSAFVCSEGRKLQDARERLDAACTILAGGGR